jgi:hypothetical protein
VEKTFGWEWMTCLGRKEQKGKRTILGIEEDV